MNMLRLCVPLVLLASSALAQTPKENPAAMVKAAGTDVVKLEQLATKWTEQKRADGARLAWKRLIELQPDHEAARAGLAHVRYDGKWFEGQTALFDYKRAEDARMAKQGLARAGDQWVPIADAKFVRLGWGKDADGKWLHPLTRLRREHDAAMAAKGCQQQDLEWIDPAEFETWRQGLWKCGDRWLDTAAADAWHSSPERPWYAVGEHFVVASTLDRARVEWCRHHADRTWNDLVRIFGIRPGQQPSGIDLYGPNGDKPELVIWNSIAQYNKFAGEAESQGWSSLHYACFCDALFDDRVQPAAHAGIGCGFWDNSTKALDSFGQYAVRHAAAQSFIEAIDPSWKALGDIALDRRTPTANQQAAQARAQAQAQAFWRDKRIPTWLRFGACSFVERWFLEPNPGEGVDPRWSRTWALESLRKAGGLRDLAKVFEFKIASADAANSTQLIHEAGLVVAFVLDGGEPRVQKAHQAFQQALAGEGPTTAAAAELQKALLAAKPALLAFAAK